jgi:hypothetical protein
MPMSNIDFIAAQAGAWVAGPGAYTGKQIEGFLVLEDTAISVLKDSGATSVLADRIQNASTLKAGAIIRASTAQRFFTEITVVSGSINAVDTKGGSVE